MTASSDSSIQIRFDKSHLSSIGERLYTQSLDLIRELVANAYDADASEVKINITDSQLIVEDNGSGMDRSGLEQYFTIGSTYKKSHPISERYKRTRIGEFGIGKFGVLGLCDRFELYTRSKNYSATIIFDREDFEQKENWSVPVIEHELQNVLPENLKTGSRVTLYQIKKDISILELERYLTNLFPLNDRHFAIFINGQRLEPKYIPGERFKIQEYTKYGSIKGEIVISSLILTKEMIGIGIRVKGILIKRATFDLESDHSLSVRRLTGEIRVDFLPITTSRNDFLKDSDEYHLFYNIMQKKLRRIIRHLQRRALSYQDKKSEKVLSDVLLMIREALKKNRDIFYTGDLPLFNRKKGKQLLNAQVSDSVISTALVKSKNLVKEPKIEENSLKKIIKEAVKNLKPRLRGRVKTLFRDDRRIVKKIRIGGSELLVSFAHLGEAEKESFVDGGIIFINRDHPMFKKVEGKIDLSFYHLLRLVTQELIKFAYPKNLEVAYDWQGKLITDAYQNIKDLNNSNKPVNQHKSPQKPENLSLINN